VHRVGASPVQSSPARTSCDLASLSVPLDQLKPERPAAATTTSEESTLRRATEARAGRTAKLRDRAIIRFWGTRRREGWNPIRARQRPAPATGPRPPATFHEPNGTAASRRPSGWLLASPRFLRTRERSGREGDGLDGRLQASGARDTRDGDAARP
jgi:hypothetical protein